VQSNSNSLNQYSTPHQFVKTAAADQNSQRCKKKKRLFIIKILSLIKYVNQKQDNLLNIKNYIYKTPAVSLFAFTVVVIKIKKIFLFYSLHL
jgi:GTP1/Obg family GTP-binding protein